MCAYVFLRVCICVSVQVVNLDPVIEDDEELQRSSKVSSCLVLKEVLMFLLCEVL